MFINYLLVQDANLIVRLLILKSVQCFLFGDQICLIKFYGIKYTIISYTTFNYIVVLPINTTSTITYNKI